MHISGRALHYVFKIGDRLQNIFFFRKILGMQVLRHDEFGAGCPAQCNGPYDQRWSRTLVGFGPETTHFVIELAYNYGVSNYRLGNDFGGITIRSQEILQRASLIQYPIVQAGGYGVLRSPDGYIFNIIDEPQPRGIDPVTEVILHCSDIEQSKHYWHEMLNMSIVTEEANSVVLAYGESQTMLRIRQISQSIRRGGAYGRMTFAVPQHIQPQIYSYFTTQHATVVTPLMTLDTPGKASVQVIVLADPDGHEVSFVDEESYYELATVEVESETILYNYIKEDPFQKK